MSISLINIDTGRSWVIVQVSFALVNISPKANKFLCLLKIETLIAFSISTDSVKN